MVTKVSKWPIQDIEVVEKWSSPSKTLVLLGDAAHAMIPFMSIGMAFISCLKLVNLAYMQSQEQPWRLRMRAPCPRA